MQQKTDVLKSTVGSNVRSSADETRIRIQKAVSHYYDLLQNRLDVLYESNPIEQLIDDGHRLKSEYKKFQEEIVHKKRVLGIPSQIFILGTFVLNTLSLIEDDHVEEEANKLINFVRVTLRKANAGDEFLHLALKKRDFSLIALVFGEEALSLTKNDPNRVVLLNQLAHSDNEDAKKDKNAKKDFTVRHALLTHLIEQGYSLKSSEWLFSQEFLMRTSPDADLNNREYLFVLALGSNNMKVLENTKIFSETFWDKSESFFDKHQSFLGNKKKLSNREHLFIYAYEFNNVPLLENQVIFSPKFLDTRRRYQLAENASVEIMRSNYLMPQSFLLQDVDLDYISKQKGSPYITKKCLNFDLCSLGVIDRALKSKEFLCIEDIRQFLNSTFPAHCLFSTISPYIGQDNYHETTYFAYFFSYIIENNAIPAVILEEAATSYKAHAEDLDEAVKKFSEYSRGARIKIIEMIFKQAEKQKTKEGKSQEEIKTLFEKEMCSQLEQAGISELDDMIWKEFLDSKINELTEFETPIMYERKPLSEAIGIGKERTLHDIQELRQTTTSNNMPLSPFTRQIYLSEDLKIHKAEEEIPERSAEAVQQYKEKFFSIPNEPLVRMPKVTSKHRSGM